MVRRIRNGKIEETTETLLVAKTRQEHLDRFVARVRAMHITYTVPEVIALPIIGGNAAYLLWMAEVLQGA